MDPKAMPWRAIDAASTMSGTPSGPGSDGDAEAPRRGPSRTTLVTSGSAVLIAIAAFVLAFGSGTSGDVAVVGGGSLAGAATAPGGGGASASTEVGGSAGGMVVVEVVGAVVKPGVYRLPAGSRIGDLLAAAGGYGPRVDTERAAHSLNRAAILGDGDQVRVPSRDDTDVGTVEPVGGGGSAAPALLDLNRATNAELEALPGIGPVTATKIVAAREETRFTAVDELRSRKLVGQKTFDGLKDLVTVR